MRALDTFRSPLTSLRGLWWHWTLSWETTTLDNSVWLLYFFRGSASLHWFPYLPRQKQRPNSDQQTFLSQPTRCGITHDFWYQPEYHQPTIQSHLPDVGYCFALDSVDHLYLVTAGGIPDLFAFGGHFWDGIANAKVMPSCFFPKLNRTLCLSITQCQIRPFLWRGKWSLS